MQLKIKEHRILSAIHEKWHQNFIKMFVIKWQFSKKFLYI